MTTVHREIELPESDTKPKPDAVRRVMAEIFDFHKSPIEGLFIKPHDQDVMTVEALIVGPMETPYAGGFFHFKLKFPNDYPYSPPAVKLMTTDGNSVRFNPNLYASGKSLMNDKPYHNEPGFENERKPGDVERYNNRIVHETLRVAVCQMVCRPDLNRVFREDIETEFLKHFDHYLKTAQEMSARLDNRPFQDPFGEMTGRFNFKAIVTQLQATYDKLTDVSDCSDISVASESDSDSDSDDED